MCHFNSHSQKTVPRPLTILLPLSESLLILLFPFWDRVNRNEPSIPDKGLSLVHNDLISSELFSFPFCINLNLCLLFWRTPYSEQVFTDESTIMLQSSSFKNTANYMSSSNYGLQCTLFCICQHCLSSDIMLPILLALFDLSEASWSFLSLHQPK